MKIWIQSRTLQVTNFLIEQPAFSQHIRLLLLHIASNALSLPKKIVAASCIGLNNFSHAWYFSTKFCTNVLAKI